MWVDLKDYILASSDSVNTKYLLGGTPAELPEIPQNPYFYSIYYLKTGI